MGLPTPWDGSANPAARIPREWQKAARSLRRLVDFLPAPSSVAIFPFLPAEHERDERVARVEAALFSSREPLSVRRLMKLASLDDADQVRDAVMTLRGLLERSNSAFQLEEIAGGYQLLTRPDLRRSLERVCQIRHGAPVSGPMLETLAIVAYRQPICRADVEAIRGVQVGEILRHLLDDGLIRLVGKEESLGRPFLYGTTPRFLQVFGLRHLNELPMVESLAKPAGKIAHPIDADNADGTSRDSSQEEDSE
ncbi:SMC-Scp complex subunit ScpB [bacterium]|nr:SMC-Scp complex subunit ScpB [bacterium]